MSKHRKAQHTAGGSRSAGGSKFPAGPVIALAIGAGLYLSFSGVLKRAAPNPAPTAAPVKPPPEMGAIASSTNAAPPVPNAQAGTSLMDLIPSELDKSDADRSHDFLNRGTELYQQGKFLEAATNYVAAVQLTPDDETAHFNLASALAKLGRISEARAAYQEALRLFPDYPEAHNNLGNLFASEGKLAEAAEHIGHALKLTPESASAQNNLGTVLIRQGRIAEAITHFSEAVRLLPDYVEARCNLGNALLSQGKVTEAAARFEEALKIKADFEPARKGLARVAQIREAPLVPNSPVPLP